MEPPAGYTAFCNTVDHGCAVDFQPGGEVREATAATMTALFNANRAINAAIAPSTDRRDEWRQDARFGDCEDFALAKRRFLMARGWRADQLLLAIGAAPGGAAHAVLIARTSLGDFILDSRSDHVAPWSETDLKWIARQSARLPAVWVRLAGDD